MKDLDKIDLHKGNLSLAGRPDSLKNSPVGNFKYAGAPSPLYSGTSPEPDTPAPPPPPPPPPPFTNGFSGSFDGSNDYAITTGTPVDMSDMANGYTFSGWMWREDVASLPSNGGTTNWLGGAYASADGSPAIPALRWYFTDEYWQGGVYKRIRWYHGIKVIDNTLILIPKGVWCHLAVTWDGSNTVTTFLNGSQIGQITNSGSLTDRADKMLIGKGHFSNKGLVDEVAYWNRGLSSYDIEAIYNDGVPDDLSSYSPVGWWRMGDNDGGTGDTITDQGVDSNGDPSGNDATMENGAFFLADVQS